MKLLFVGLMGAYHPTQTLTIVNQAGVPARQLERVERAVSLQAIRMRRAWGTPRITFGPAGWPVVLQRGLACNPSCGGYHSYAGGIPDARVNVDLKPWTYSFSHEILEMLEDPYGGRPEVCDPLDAARIVLGVEVARWAGPMFFLRQP